jgi:hypothetical protein
MDVNAHETVREYMDCKKTRHERDTSAHKTMREDEYRKKLDMKETRMPIE